MIRDDGTPSDEHTLEFLLAFDGRIHHLEQGYWIKFEIKRGKPTQERPHGLRYSFTLHDPRGHRLLGFDNAHAVSPKAARFRSSAPSHDHWHTTPDDEGRPYRFTGADQLLVDFEAAVTRALSERGVSSQVVRESVSTKRKTR
jgi:hypothetical protein